MDPLSTNGSDQSEVGISVTLGVYLELQQLNRCDQPLRILLTDPRTDLE